MAGAPLHLLKVFYLWPRRVDEEVVPVRGSRWEAWTALHGKHRRLSREVERKTPAVFAWGPTPVATTLGAPEADALSTELQAREGRSYPPS